MKAEWCAAMLLAVAATGCGEDAETAKRRYVENGDRYAEAKQYAEAIIEYRSAIATDLLFGEAHFKLARSLEAAGELQRALPEYVRAADLMPQDAAVQLRAGQLLLSARQYPEARARAIAVLAINPRDVDGLILLGNTLSRLQDFSGAVSQLEEAIENDPQRTIAYANLGAVNLARGDAEAAEAAFKSAVQSQPTSVPAHLGLGNYYWSAGRHTEAEASLKQALALDPKSPMVLQGLAGLNISARRMQDAETYLKAYVDVVGTTESKVTLADFYLQVGKIKEAEAVLVPLVKTEGGFVPATLRLAGLDYAAGRREQAHTKLGVVLAQDAKNEPALLMKGRFLIAERKPAEALKLASAVTEVNPKSLRGHYLRGVALEEAGKRDEALEAYRQVLALSPSAVQAQIRVTELLLARGDAKGAAGFTGNIVKTNPRSARFRVLAARAALGVNDLARAEVELRAIPADSADSAQVHSLFGDLYSQQRDIARARTSYNRALALDPQSVAALQGLIRADLSEKKPEAARARLLAHEAKGPETYELSLLAAQTFSAVGDEPRAEAAARKGIEIDPSRFEAYTLLAGLYMRRQRLDEARVEYEKLAKEHPQMKVGATTMVGIILGLRGMRDESRRYYQQALAADPRAAVAANNLAWSYAETGENLDVAMQLAQTAKSQLPDNADVSDTLGWIYYQKGLADLAVTALEEAARQSPTNGAVHYRLGMAQLKKGEKPEGRASLERALKLGPTASYAEDARRALAG